MSEAGLSAAGGPVGESSPVSLTVQAERHASTIRGALWHGQGLGGHNNYRAAENALAELLALAAGDTPTKSDPCMFPACADGHGTGRFCEGCGG